MPSGILSICATVTAVPPAAGILLSAPRRLMPLVFGEPVLTQNTIDWPSGEKTGFPKLVCDSLPAIGRAVLSDIDRTNRRLLATYAICVPSGEIATDGRKGSVNAWPSGMT